MRIVIYGNQGDSRLLLKLMKTRSPLAFRRTEYLLCESYDHYLTALREHPAELVFVVANGADGMESVIAARDLQPNTPVAWFSDDRAFVSQAYRLDVAYFGVKPPCAETVAAALEKCQQRRRRLDAE